LLDVSSGKVVIQMRSSEKLYEAVVKTSSTEKLVRTDLQMVVAV